MTLGLAGFVRGIHVGTGHLFDLAWGLIKMWWNSL